MTSASSIATEDACSRTFPIAAASVLSAASAHYSLSPGVVFRIKLMRNSSRNREAQRAPRPSHSEASGYAETPAPPRALRGTAKGIELRSLQSATTFKNFTSSACSPPPWGGSWFVVFDRDVRFSVVEPRIFHHTLVVLGGERNMEEEARVLFAAAELGRADIIGKAIESLTAGDLSGVGNLESFGALRRLLRRVDQRSGIHHPEEDSRPRGKAS